MKWQSTMIQWLPSWSCGPKIDTLRYRSYDKPYVATMCVVYACKMDLFCFVFASVWLVKKKSRDNARSQRYILMRVTVYKCLHGSAPAYLTGELCQVADVEARQRLRSSLSSLLIVSRTRLLTVGDRAFQVAAARVWNSLPDLVTSAPSVAVFQSRLKTHLFNISYPCDCTVPAQWH